MDEMKLTLLSMVLLPDHHVKEKDRQRKKDKKKEWKNNSLPPVHDITRENGDVIFPQKGKKKKYKLNYLI